MRAVGVHPDAVVVTSRMWQTTCTAIRAGDEAMLIDSPYFPDELDALPGAARPGGLRDHARCSRRTPTTTICSGGRRSRSSRSAWGSRPRSGCAASPGVAQKELRDADDEHYVERAAPLALGSYQSLPVPGLRRARRRGARAAPGRGPHRRRHGRVRALGGRPVRGRLPLGRRDPDGRSDLEEYRATLARLAPLVEAAETIVPGHGSPHDRDTALRLLDEDLEYLDGFAKLPPGRDTTRQREIHAANLRRSLAAWSAGRARRATSSADSAIPPAARSRARRSRPTASTAPPISAPNM